MVNFTPNLSSTCLRCRWKTFSLRFSFARSRCPSAVAKLYWLQFLLSTANDVCHFCAGFSPVPIFIKATLGVYQHQFAIMKHGACIPLMCDHYTNEVNGSAVLTKRWMPPSGSCPPLRGSWCASENSLVRVSAFGRALNSDF